MADIFFEMFCAVIQTSITQNLGEINDYQPAPDLLKRQIVLLTKSLLNIPNDIWRL